jgi:hypothetical protein
VTSISRHKSVWVRDSKRYEWHTHSSFMFCTYTKWPLHLASSLGQTCKGRKLFLCNHVETSSGATWILCMKYQGHNSRGQGGRSSKLTTHLRRGRLQDSVNGHFSFTYFLHLHLWTAVPCVSTMLYVKRKIFLKICYFYLKGKLV